MLENGKELIDKLESIDLEEVSPENEHFSQNDYFVAQTMLKMIQHKSIKQPY